MDDSPVGLVILIATLVVFAAVAVWFIWAARNWAWPRGNRVKGEYRGVRCTLVFTDEGREDMGLDEKAAQHLATDCARASWCAREAWGDVGVDPTHDPKRLNHVVVRFLTEHEFFGPDSIPNEGERAPAETLLKVGKRVGGDYLPMPTIRTKFRELVQETGEPVIHALCHQLVWDAKNDGIKLYDYMHADGRVWVAAGGEGTVQGVARKMYLGEQA